MVKSAKKIHGNSTYTDELGVEICNAIATSADGLEKLIEQNPNWPRKEHTIHKWRLTIPEFGELYARAKQQQIDVLVEKALKISEERKHDYVDGEHGLVGNPTAVNRDKLRIDTIKWVACKLAPRVYGDKTQVENKVDIENMSKEELAKVVDALPNDAKIRLIETIMEQLKAKELANE